MKNVVYLLEILLSFEQFYRQKKAPSDGVFQK